MNRERLQLIPLVRLPFPEVRKKRGKRVSAIKPSTHPIDTLLPNSRLQTLKQILERAAKQDAKPL